jgi:hypothetical protein
MAGVSTLKGPGKTQGGQPAKPAGGLSTLQGARKAQHVERGGVTAGAAVFRSPFKVHAAQPGGVTASASACRSHRKAQAAEPVEWTARTSIFRSPSRTSVFRSPSSQAQAAKPGGVSDGASALKCPGVRKATPAGQMTAWPCALLGPGVAHSLDLQQPTTGENAPPYTPSRRTRHSGRRPKSSVRSHYACRRAGRSHGQETPEPGDGGDSGDSESDLESNQEGDSCTVHVQLRLGAGFGGLQRPVKVGATFGIIRSCRNICVLRPYDMHMFIHAWIIMTCTFAYDMHICV